MSRYIDADKLLEKEKPKSLNDDIWINSSFYKTIMNAPTEKVTPIIYGTWIKSYRNYNCSICGRIALSWNDHGIYRPFLSSCCPWCGAKMENAER